jgi:hypothetical protein
MRTPLAPTSGGLDNGAFASTNGTFTRSTNEHELARASQPSTAWAETGTGSSTGTGTGVLPLSSAVRTTHWAVSEWHANPAQTGVWMAGAEPEWKGR